MIADSIRRLAQKSSLTYDDARSAVSEMLSGGIPDAECAAFLAGMAEKGETDDEILGMLDAMQERAMHIKPEPDAIDMCGTGGDSLGTFNISTAASFVAASAGAKVAKHGNRSRSSASGSADVFEYIGYDLDSSPECITKALKEYNIAFMFAQKFHPAMRHVAGARRQVAGRTAFNLLGPLSNPAGVKRQLVGVYGAEWLERIPRILHSNGAERVMAVRADNGMDEFSTAARNSVCFLQDGTITKYDVSAKDVGLRESSLAEIQVKTREESMASFMGALRGTATRGMVETVALNAAGGLVVAGIAKDLSQGVETALDAIYGQKAYSHLERFVAGVGNAEIMEAMP